MEHHKKEARNYVTSGGKTPYEEWMDDLPDMRAHAAIQARVSRLEFGNPGNYRYVGQGVRELKIDFGPGYRVYYGEDGDTLIILLCGGDKSSQKRDIRKAQAYWQDYWRMHEKN